MRPCSSTYDRTFGDVTTALIDALRADDRTVETLIDGAVMVDGRRIEPSDWDRMAAAWDGTLGGLAEIQFML